MKSQDIEAIRSLDPANHVYLAVIKENGIEHLQAVTKKRCWSRLWMKMGLSSASMSRVIRYLNKEALMSESVSPDLDPKFALLKKKVKSFEDNRLVNRIRQIFNCICLKDSSKQKVQSSNLNSASTTPQVDTVVTSTTPQKNPVATSSTPQADTVETATKPPQVTTVTNTKIPQVDTAATSSTPQANTVETATTPPQVTTVTNTIIPQVDTVATSTTSQADTVVTSPTDNPVAQAPQTTTTSTPHSALTTKEKLNNFREKFKHPKFDPSATKMDINDWCHENFKIQCNEFVKFLKDGPNTDADLVYVCVGHGNVVEQIWPGFVLNKLQNNKKVFSLLIELGHSHDGFLAATELNGQHEIYPKKRGSILEFTHNFSIKQYSCGMPETRLKTLEDADGALYNKGGQCYGTNNRWETKQQINTAILYFQQYIEKLLVQGKKVVLSDHCGQIALENTVVNTYNNLVQKFPSQLYFLWGWEGINRMTSQVIKEKDLENTSLSSIWNHYPREQVGLAACEID